MIFRDVPIRGAYFRGADVLSLVNSLSPGAELTFEREPENEHDHYAIKAVYEGVHIGYVAKEIASWLAPHMDEGFAPRGVVTSMQAGFRGSLEPWATIGGAEQIENFGLIEDGDQ